jgi:protein-disulfide isomerase
MSMSAKHRSKNKQPRNDHHQTAHAHTKHEAHTKKPAAGKRGDDALKNAAIIILSLALIAVLIWAFTNSGDGKEKPLTPGGTTSTIQAASGPVMDAQTLQAMKSLTDDRPFMGAEDAPIVMVEFSSFQCSFCVRFWQETLPQIKERFVETGVVKFVYKDLPLAFPNAQKAAEAAKCAHDQGKFWEYHDIIFQNTNALDDNSLKSYAARLSLDVAEFDNCLASGKHAEAVRKDAADASAYGITGTPGFVINGERVTGAQPFDAFERIICQLAPDVEPCQHIEPPVPVDVIVLNDARCPTCDSAPLKAVTRELFPGVTFRDVDASSQEGRNLISTYGFVYAPTFIFSSAVTETKTWRDRPDMPGFFLEVEGMYRLRDEATGAEWFLDEETRIAFLAEIDDKLGITRDDGRPQVDFFLMSYCPYGNQAEELLKPVFDQLKGKADFNPRYVIYNQGNGCYTDTDGTQLCSLRGGVELNQNMRELCVFYDEGEQAWFDFALAMNTRCTSDNADTCWPAVAESLGLDKQKITSCFDENKVRYAREQYELTRALSVSGSPTVFFEGQLYNGARSSNGYLGALCAGFDNPPAACDNVIQEAVQAVAQGTC